jgi:hypothetical protein
MPLYAAFFVSNICDENRREVVLKKSHGAIFNSEAGPKGEGKDCPSNPLATTNIFTGLRYISNLSFQNY